MSYRGKAWLAITAGLALFWTAVVALVVRVLHP